MDAGDLITQARKELNDKVAPYLWDDDTLSLFLDDAQTMFCRLTDGIPDSTTDTITKISIVPDTSSYVLDEHVKKVRAAWRLDTGKPLDVINVEDMGPRGMYFDGTKNPVTALITGMDELSLIAWPVPNETVDVRLSVYRLPLTSLVDVDTLEIPAQHHLHLLLWLKHLAYGVHDAETYDKTKAETFESAFRAYCAGVKQEQSRRRHHTRVVAYGGIGGFTSSDPYLPRSRW